MLRPPARIVPLDAEVAPLDPPELFQPDSKTRQAGLSVLISFRMTHQDADPPHTLLPTRRERPRGRATQSTEKFPPLHDRPRLGQGIVTVHVGSVEILVFGA